MRVAATGGGFSSIRLLQLTTFVSTFDRFAMPPMLIAIAHDLGVPLSHVVQAAGAYFLAYGFMQPVWGIISDSLGLVRTMRLTLLLAAISTTAAALVWTPQALGLARGLAGGFFGAAYPASLIYLGDTVPAQERQPEITQLLVGVALGTALASLGAGLVAQFFSWRTAFVVTGLASLALTVRLRHLVEPSQRRVHRTIFSPIVEVARSRPAKFVLMLAFVEGAVLLGVLTLLPSAVESAGATATLAGAVIGIYGLAVFPFARMTAGLSRRLHPSRLIALGAVAALTACVILAYSRTPTVSIAGAVLLGLAWAAMHSTLQTWATEVMPRARATVISLFAGALFAGSAVAAVLVAGLAEAGRYGAIFGLAAATTIPLGVLATWGRARWRRPRTEAA